MDGWIDGWMDWFSLMQSCYHIVLHSSQLIPANKFLPINSCQLIPANFNKSDCGCYTELKCIHIVPRVFTIASFGSLNFTTFSYDGVPQEPFMFRRKLVNE